MKMSLRLAFLVLAVASVCQGQNQTAMQGNRTSAPTLASPTMESSTTPMASHQNRTLANQLDVLSTAMGQTPGTQGENKTPSGKVHDPDEQKTTTPAADITVVSTISTKSVTTEAVSPAGPHASGFALLVLLILVIVILLIILYQLRRASRTYSFNLRRAAPGYDAEQTAGNFEVLDLDDQVLQEEAHVNHSKASDIRDSKPAIPVLSPEKSDSSVATEKEPDQDDITSPDSNGLLAEKDPNEPLPLDLFIASPEASLSSISLSSSYLD
ncbi:uncharacterized protein LOC144035025 [Vanacampus margaritifer]